MHSLRLIALPVQSVQNAGQAESWVEPQLVLLAEPSLAPSLATTVRLQSAAQPLAPLQEAQIMPTEKMRHTNGNMTPAWQVINH
jgi:hypothetical protein